jgi:hypothetical protein
MEAEPPRIQRVGESKGMSFEAQGGGPDIKCFSIKMVTMRNDTQGRGVNACKRMDVSALFSRPELTGADLEPRASIDRW